MIIARVFPRKTNASPDDSLAFFGPPPLGVRVDVVHISTCWTYDACRVEELARQWGMVAPVKIGGPAMGDRGGAFKPGLYLKHGYVITSRGCPNHCWFCDVPKREGKLREIAVTSGWELLDSNILACSEQHIRKVFTMLKGQSQPVKLTGGLEAARLDNIRLEMLWDLRPNQMFFAYDTPDDYEPLVVAGRSLRYADFTRRHCQCYVLIGYPNDTIKKARDRLLQTWSAGFMPMAMLFMNKKGDYDKEWKVFQREWSRPAIIKANVKHNYFV